MRTVFNLSNHIEKADYQSLIDFIAGISLTFSLVSSDHLINEKIKSDLRDDYLSTDKKDEWPGTKLIGSMKYVHLYRVSSKSISTLKECVNSLYDWLEPQFPEDLCFYDENNDPVLVTISHEMDSFVYLNDEHINFKKKFFRIIKE